jgi:hypothetical protein
MQYLTQTCLLSSGFEFGDLFQVPSVFVASREKVKGVLNRQNPFFLEELGELGPYPLHVLDRGEEAIPGILRLRRDHINNVAPAFNAGNLWDRPQLMRVLPL